jgi:hypothetical protein
MECHDAKLLLTFTQRKSEDVDAAERAALDQHLGACPDCAAFAQVDAKIDAAFSKVMLDVPVPADLQKKIMQRVTAQQPVRPWKWMAAAAVLLGVCIGGAVWYQQLPENLVFADVENQIVQADASAVQQYLKGQGVDVSIPTDFDYRYLQHADVVHFHGRRVAKLTFAHNGRPSSATVLILPKSQFHMDEAKDFREADHPSTTTILIRHSADGGFVYVVYCRGDIAFLQSRAIG